MVTRPEERIAAMLMHHEGLRLKPYTDTTGHLSIGYGRNLTDVGISVDEARCLLRHDIATATGDLFAAFPWAERLDPVRQAVLVSMAFNLGLPTLKTFRTTLEAFRVGHWAAAADGMLDSLWARQVGQRAKDLAAMVRTQTWPPYTLTMED